MKKLIASVILASVASTAFAIPPSHPQPIVGEAQGASTVQAPISADRTLSESGFDRTPLGEQLAEDGFDLTPQADQVADDGFERTPLGQLLAEDGSDRTGLGTV